jgi:hypothetical protein
MNTISNPKGALTLLSAQHLVADTKPRVERVKMRVARSFMIVYGMNTGKKKYNNSRKSD